MLQYIKEKREHIRRSTMLQKFLRNTGWMLTGRVATMIISFFATLFIARHLGPTNYGQLSFAISMNGLFAFIAPLGLDQILFRELVRTPEKKNELLGTTLLLKLAAGTLAATLSIITAFTIKAEDITRILIVILSGTFIFNAFLIINYEFLSRSESKYQSIISIATSATLNILKILAILLSKGVIYLALILLLEAVLNAILYVFIYQTKIEENIQSWTWNKQLAKLLVRDSLPVVLLTAFANIYSRVDQVIIKYMLDVTQVGVYDAAVRVAELWSFLPSIIITALVPSIVSSTTEGGITFKKRMRQGIALLTVIPSTIAALVGFFAPLIVHVLYGKGYEGSVSILQIYVWSGVFTSLGLFFYQYLIAMNLRFILIFSSFVPMVLNIILNIVWIPLYGINGAAYATLVSYMFLPASLLFFKSTRNMILGSYRAA